jgi:hypothetical protein
MMLRVYIYIYIYIDLMLYIYIERGASLCYRILYTII